MNVAGRSITDINDLVPTYPVRNAWRSLQKSALIRERQRVTILATCWPGKIHSADLQDPLQVQRGADTAYASPATSPLHPGWSAFLLGKQCLSRKSTHDREPGTRQVLLPTGATRGAARLDTGSATAAPPWASRPTCTTGTRSTLGPYTAVAVACRKPVANDAAIPASQNRVLGLSL